MYADQRWEQKTETNPPEPWRRLLLDAADLIEKRGHCKNTLMDSKGALCIGGALSMAVTGNAFNFDFNATNFAASERLRDFCGGCFVSYNNAPERTAAEVLAAMRACAAAP